MQRQKVYLISGTLGAGKTTVSKLVAVQIKDCILINGDVFMHMPQNDQNPNWEDKLKFCLDNIIHTAKSALKLNLDVVIDGVVRVEFAELKEAFKDYEIHYHILTADEETLKSRIRDRGTPEMIEESMEVLKLVKNNPENVNFIIDTSNLTPEEVKDLILKRK